MLHNEGRFHAEMGSLFDGERLRLESFNRTWCSQVDRDIGASFNFESERFDDTAPLIFGVNWEGRRAADAERGFPAIQ